jgi:DNA modification methylase
MTMAPYYERGERKIFCGNMLEVLEGFEAGRFSRVITDPPYELGFMGKSWDSSGVAFQVETWRKVLRVCKPGAMLLAFGGTRTFHRLTCAIEDAGWEIRDCMMWLYGSGFPKSLDISKAIDKRPGVHLHDDFKRDLAKARESHGISRKKLAEMVVGTASGAVWNWEHHQFPEARHWSKLKASLPSLDDRWGEVLANAERDVLESRKGKDRKGDGTVFGLGHGGNVDVTSAKTGAASEWSGWGTALKPAWEPIIVAMKPLDGTFAENALQHGVAGLNIDGGRVEYESDGTLASNPSLRKSIKGGSGGHIFATEEQSRCMTPHSLGRWPANVILDEEAGQILDTQTGDLGKSTGGRSGKSGSSNAYGVFASDGSTPVDPGFGDTGGASRFFYCAKASKSDRGEGNNHNTVKPRSLMKYLLTLTAQPGGGEVLDPFMGSGTTLVAAQELGQQAVGIDMEKDHCEIAKKRLEDDGGLF